MTYQLTAESQSDLRMELDFALGDLASVEALAVDLRVMADQLAEWATTGVLLRRSFAAVRSFSDSAISLAKAANMAPVSEVERAVHAIRATVAGQLVGVIDAVEDGAVGVVDGNTAEALDSVVSNEISASHL